MKYIAITISVFLLLGACKTPVDTTTLYNKEASLTKDDSLPFNPLEWPVITTVMNTNKHTMSTLYGNEIALAHARDSGNQYYPPGSVLCLVAWTQQEDKHWFGANIPKKIQSIEVVSTEVWPNATVWTYKCYEGTPLRLRPNSCLDAHFQRTTYILDQRMSVIP